MFQLGKGDDNQITWFDDLIFDSFDSASVAAKKLFAISGSIYMIKQIGGFVNV